MVTLVIGYLVWMLIVFKNGQTPGKQLLGMRAVNVTIGEPAGWGRTFVREIIAKPLIGYVVGWLVIPYLWLLWDKDNQELWDKIVDTVVVDDPNHQLTSKTTLLPAQAEPALLTSGESSTSPASQLPQPATPGTTSSLQPPSS
jgi:uncharacterized RDD family membrane protein YckC